MCLALVKHIRRYRTTISQPFKKAYNARSLPAFGRSDHAAIFLTPKYKQRLVQEPPVKREVMRWSSHSEAMLQAALDDVDWDMFRASSSDVREFTDVALSFVNTLTEQATEMVTIRTFSNQKPWVDRSIRDVVNHRTAAYNAGLLSGNMSEYKALCYALRAVRADQLAGLFKSIFNESLATSVVPTSFKKNMSSSLCLRSVNPLA